jgi:hypothetical protein
VADPTSLIEFAEREVTDLKAAVLAANTEVTDSRTAFLAAQAALTSANDQVAAANASLAEIRHKLAKIGMPADGEPLLVDLRNAIVDQRSKAAALTAADLTQAKAAARLTQAQSLVSELTLRRRAAEAAKSTATAAKKRRDDAIAAVAAKPLKDINQAATDALANAKFASAKARIEGALPEPLRKQAVARAAQALAAVSRAEAREAAAQAVVDGLAEASGLATDTLPRLRRSEAHAEASLLAWVDGAPRRLTVAVAAVHRLAGLNAPPLTPEQKASIDADASARATAAQAEEKWDAAAAKVAGAFNELEIERLKLRAADPDADDADIAAAEANPATDAGKAKKKWDDAKAELATEDANFTAAMRTVMANWRAVVPDSLWLEAEAFLSADAELKQLASASAAPLITALNAAEAALLAALIDDAKRRRRLDWSASRLAQEAAMAASARSHAAALASLAFRGHPTPDL